MPNYTNPGIIEFDGVVNRTDGGGAFVDFPYSVEELFNVRGRVPITATFDGLPYQGSMVNMGGSMHRILMLKSIREQLGLDRGDLVHMTVELDTEERTVDLPVDARMMLEEKGLLETYDQLAFTHQREYVRWIEDAQRPETRQRRLWKLAEMVAAGNRLKG